MGINDQDIRGKDFGELRKIRKWTKDDWILYAQSLLAEKDARIEADQRNGTAAEWKQKAETAQKQADFYEQESKAATDREIDFEDKVFRLKHELEKAKSARKESTGRRITYTMEQVRQIKKLHSEGMGVRKIATHIGLSHMTISRIINKYNTANEEL